MQWQVQGQAKDASVRMLGFERKTLLRTHANTHDKQNLARFKQSCCDLFCEARVRFKRESAHENETPATRVTIQACAARVTLRYGDTMVSMLSGKHGYVGNYAYIGNSRMQKNRQTCSAWATMRCVLHWYPSSGVTMMTRIICGNNTVKPVPCMEPTHRGEGTSL